VRSNLFRKYSFDRPLRLEAVQGLRLEGLAGLSPVLTDPRIFVLFVNRELTKRCYVCK
jgi:hypothetical protein